MFRESVFTRDKHTCVNCGAPGVDAHHILERRLFPDGGYYVDNGATVCTSCHLAAESTELSCEQLREKAGIRQVVLPPHLYPDQRYDKWGNPILENGTRLQGELFEDSSIQKIIQPVLHLFTNRVKYPRTWHLPWSPGFTDDDRVLSEDTVASWEGTEVVITEKMDGENTTMYGDYIHARSLEYSSHPSRHRVKAIHAAIAYDIPPHMRICGENLTAVHSLKYSNLPSHFMVFSLWVTMSCMSWDETVLYSELLGLKTVPVLFKGPWNHRMNQMEALHAQIGFKPDRMEGYVVRPAGQFHYGDFPYVVGKFVRKNHVQTHGHWMRQRLEYNDVRE